MRSPRGLVDRLTLSGAPAPRATSHSVWPSATTPVVFGAAAAASDSALASAGPTGGVIPGHNPSALIRSSGVTCLSGVNGGVSIETFLMNVLPERENQSASLDNRSEEKISEVLAQPATIGATSSSDSSTPVR